MRKLADPFFHFQHYVIFDAQKSMIAEGLTRITPAIALTAGDADEGDVEFFGLVFDGGKTGELAIVIVVVNEELWRGNLAVIKAP